MSNYSKRVHQRQYIEAPILFWFGNQEDLHNGFMRNSSVGGIYFETGLHLKPGADLHILMADDFSDGFVHDDQEGYAGEVMWCTPVTPKKRFGVGVQKQHIIYTCDMCGEAISFRKIKKSNEYVYLCPDCHRQIGNLPDPRIQQRIEEFLMGNVL